LGDDEDGTKVDSPEELVDVTGLIDGKEGPLGGRSDRDIAKSCGDSVGARGSRVEIRSDLMSVSSWSEVSDGLSRPRNF
jgi:hypothetical protein